MTKPRRSTLWRFMALIAVLALVAAACDTDEAVDTTEPPDVDVTEPPDVDVTEPPDEPPTGVADVTYRVGYFEDPLSDNHWAYLGPSSSVWTGYVLGPTKPSLYTVQFPGLEIRNQVAAEETVPEPFQDGDIWVTEVTVRDDAVWSDGEPITADDIVFTAETVRDFGLAPNWAIFYPWADPDDPDAGLGLIGASADGSTVRFEWNRRPGLGIWGIGNGPHNGDIMAKHHWEEHVAAAGDAADLYAVSGVGDPSGGMVTFEIWEEGAFSRNVANELYFDMGREITSGDVTFQEGPFVADVEFALYGSIDAAVLALGEGEVDFLLNPLGLPAGLRPTLLDNPELEPVLNPTNGYRYLGFNMRNPPLNDVNFRQALATRIDKDFVNDSVLQGVALSMYVHVPEGNTAWFPADLEAEVAARYEFENDFARFGAAVDILVDAGYTWQSDPGCLDAGAEERGPEPIACSDPTAATVIPGEGLIMPDGTPVPELTMFGPGPAYDPLRAAWGTWIDQWANELGIPLDFFPSDFNFLVDTVFPAFVAEESSADDLDFDMWILGFSLGNPAWPTFHRTFFGSDFLWEETGGRNHGFVNEEYDALAAQFDEAESFEEGLEIVHSMEEILAEELPFILLFDTGILEAFRSNVEFPFTDTLGGIVVQEGLQGEVQLLE